MYTVREEKAEELQRRGGLDMVGRLEEKRWIDGRRKRTEKKERHSYCRWWGFRVRPPSTTSWNKQTAVRHTDRAISNGREARCALDVSLHLSFSKCCFVCSPLNKAAEPQKRTMLYLLLYIITSHSRQACFLL